MRANALEPVTLVRSPTFTKPTTGVMLQGSKPDKRMAAILASLITQPPYRLPMNEADVDLPLALSPVYGLE